MSGPAAPGRGSFTDPHRMWPAPPALREMDEQAVRAELRAARRVVAATRKRMPSDARECACHQCTGWREIRESIWQLDDVVDAERARLARQQLPLDFAAGG